MIETTLGMVYTEKITDLYNIDLSNLHGIEISRSFAFSDTIATPYI